MEVYLCSNGENHSEVRDLPMELSPKIEHLMCFKCIFLSLKQNLTVMYFSRDHYKIVLNICNICGSKHALRSNAEGCDGKTHQTDS